MQHLTLTTRKIFLGCPFITRNLIDVASSAWCSSIPLKLFNLGSKTSDTQITSVEHQNVQLIQLIVFLFLFRSLSLGRVIYLICLTSHHMFQLSWVQKNWILSSDILYHLLPNSTINPNNNKQNLGWSSLTQCMYLQEFVDFIHNF